MLWGIPVIFVLLLWGWSRSARQEHYLRIHLETQPGSLNVTTATGRRENQILRAIGEGLTRNDPETLEPLPGVAKSWDVSSNGLTYTFHLRDEARWSDGKLVTAQEFWDAWEQILNPKTKAAYVAYFYRIKNGEAYARGKITDPTQIGMKVLDPHTFQVTLERPTPYFLPLITTLPAFYPIHKEDPNQYNGPFVLASWIPDKGILLLPNEHYWGRNEVKLPGVQFLFFNNFYVALQRYDTKGIDVLNDLPPDQISILKWRQDFRANHDVIRTDYLTLNLHHAPLDSTAFRRALSAAIDRETLTNKILRRGDLPYGSFIPPKMPGFKTDQHGQKFNPTAAKIYLKAAGFGLDKTSPVLDIYCINATDRLIVVEAIQKMWKENLGIESLIHPMEWKDFLQARKEGKVTIGWGAWVADYLEPTTFLELMESDHAQNYTGWSNTHYDALVKEGEHEPNRLLRAQKLEEAEGLLLDEAPIIPVLVKAQSALVRPYVKGYVSNLLDIHPLRDVYLSEH